MRIGLMLRKTFDSFTVDKIEKILRPELQSIKFGAKREGLKLEENWSDYISEEKLKSIEHRDIDVCENKNMYRFSKHLSNKILHILKQLYPENIIYSAGHFYYPPTGYMGWHTNYSSEGERLYLTFASESNKSFFRYRDVESKEVVTDYDDAGLTVRSFPALLTRPYFWHCVGSECDRFSFGYRLKPIES